MEYIEDCCPWCYQFCSCLCDKCHLCDFPPDASHTSEPFTGGPLNARLFGNLDECKDETEDFLSLEDCGDLYLVVATPYDDKYAKNESWYHSPLAFRAVARMVDSTNYVMTREYLHVAKAHINCLVYSDEDLVEKLHDKNKYKYHYHVQRVERPRAARDYIFKDAAIYSFINNHDYVIYYVLK